MKKNIIYNVIVAALVLFSVGACDDDNDMGSGGTPVVRYIRPVDVEASDSLLSSAYLGAKIAIIGESLGGVNKIYFNDQKASLNPNFVTDDAIIVSIPNTIPDVKEDLLKLYTSNDSTYYSFEAQVPAPKANSMDCEYLEAGDVAHIEGLYFVDDKTSPLTVTFTGGVQGEIESSDVNNIYVTVPEGAENGPVTVASIYGSEESSFHFRDNRNLILTFEPDKYPDYGYYFGWHGGLGIATENGVNGPYLVFAFEDEDNEMTDDTWDDSHFGFEKWTYLSDDPDFFDTDKFEDYALKFEANIPEVWSAAAFQVIFTGAEDVMLNWQNGNGLTFNPDWGSANDYVGDEAWPRALWIPWADTGSFQTDGWITVTIPMTEFKYNGSGGEVPMKGAGHYSGITLFVNGGGITGTPCKPVFHIDNVRIVPN